MRHNAILKYVLSRVPGGQVEVEPVIQSGQNRLKLDAVIVGDNHATVLDAQTITDSFDLDEAYEEKRRKYGGKSSCGQ